MFILDAHFSPHLAPWLKSEFAVEAFSLRFLEMSSFEDLQIFKYSKKRNAIVITKDADFVQLHERFGSPPKIVYVTCGNTSNEKMKALFRAKFPLILELISQNDLIELTD